MHVDMRRCVELLLFVALLMALVACGTNQVPGQSGAGTTGIPIREAGTPITTPTPTSCTTTPTTTPTPIPSPTQQKTPTTSRPGVPLAP